MVPNHIITMAEIPRTLNGKVDRQRLQETFEHYWSGLTTQTPALQLNRDSREQALVTAINAVLGTVLGVSGLDCSFVQLGGDSISAIQLASQLRALGYALPVVDILRRIPLSNLVSTMASASSTTFSHSHLEPAPGATIPLTPIQETFFRWSLRNPHHFNQSLMLELNMPLTTEQLNTALNKLTQHHRILRSRFVPLPDNRWAHQLAASPHEYEPWTVGIECDRAGLSTQLLRVQRTLNLEKGHLLRAALVHLHDTPSSSPRRLLFLTAHHLVVDLVSWRIILEDLHRLLSFHLPTPIPITFGAWACALQAWHKQCSRCLASSEPAQSFSIPLANHAVLDSNTEGRCQTMECTLPTSYSAILTRLDKFSRSINAEPIEFLAGALAYALHCVTSESTVTIWQESHGRHAWCKGIDLSRTVGWFTLLYPINLTIHRHWSYSQLLQRTRHAMHALPHHGYMHGSHCQYWRTIPEKQEYRPMGVLLNFLGRVAEPGTLAQQDSSAWVACLPRIPGLQVCDANERRPQLLEVLGYQRDDAIHFELVFSPSIVAPQTIAIIIEQFQAALQGMLAEYARGTVYWAPSDFPLANLAWNDLDKLSSILAQLRISPDDVEDLYPMLPTQHKLLAATAKDASQYTVQMAITVQGNCDLAHVERAFRNAVARNAVLRTQFILPWHQANPHGLQVVLRSADFEWRTANTWAELNAIDEDDFMRQNQARGFAIGGCMLRVAAVPLLPQSLRMVIAMHHAMTDGWSFGLLLTEFLNCMHLSPRSHPKEGHASLRDYINHRNQLNDELSQQFWLTYLAGVRVPTVLSLPHDVHAKEAEQSCKAVLVDNLVSFQHRVCKAGVTPYSVLKAAWALLIYHYTHQRQVVFGNAVSGRALNVPHIDHIMGCLINTVPFVVHIDPSMALRTLLLRVSQASNAMTPHEHCHETTLQQWLGSGVDVQSLYNTLLVYENYPWGPHTTGKGNYALSHLKTMKFTEYDLTVIIQTHANALVVDFSWNQKSFQYAHVQRLAQQFRELTLLLAQELSKLLSSVTIADIDFEPTTSAENHQ
ncbi:hypothetical protein H4R35_006285 [Dimargaris xerosporica]|nr:hypothetical protein H4R35_006285 [Dimargaris xerosporica]